MKDHARNTRESSPVQKVSHYFVFSSYGSMRLSGQVRPPLWTLLFHFVTFNAFFLFLNELSHKSLAHPGIYRCKTTAVVNPVGNGFAPSIMVGRHGPCRAAVISHENQLDVVHDPVDP